MYMIKANINEGVVRDVEAALLKLGVARLRMAPINGYTSGCEREIVYRGTRQRLALCPEVEIETIADDERVDDVVGVILTIARTVHGDGYVTVTPVEQCYRIRTGVREF